MAVPNLPATRWVAGLVWSIGALVAAPAAAAAQSAIAGRVIDSVGRPMPGVAVQVVSAEQTRTFLAVTAANGTYDISPLSPGRYDVTFSLANFAQVRRSGVTVGPEAAVGVDATLLWSVSASVVVTARDTFRNLADLDHPELSLVGVARAASEGAVTGRQLESRPIMRAGEVLEAVPGVIISQHGGEGKANQYYLRGFNLDHGTDFATSVAGVPINLPSHAHGQGYADLNLLIPELVTGVQFRKGPYDAEQGDFSTAGSANVNYASVLARPFVTFSSGQDGWRRVLAAASPTVARGTLLVALEASQNDGPWQRPDRYRKLNGVVRFSRGDSRNAFSITGLSYRGRWNATDQIPVRAVTAGTVDRFGGVDSSNGGDTARHSAVVDLQRTSSGGALTSATAFVSQYRLNLFSNFTYALDDPERGDQFEQADRRWVTGGRVVHRRRTRIGSVLGESAAGITFRRDRIPTVGLYHTQGRMRLETVRQDAVTQSAVGAFVENEMHWHPWLRTTGSLRLDRYRFDVQADLPANSGRRSAGLVSPKGSIALGPWGRTEIYLNAGTGFHSNDARGTTQAIDPTTGEPASPVTPLVRAKGGEIGLRSIAIPGVQTTLSLWRLDLDSELVFVGDAGTTDASRPSRRYGIEWSAYARPTSWLTIDADLAWSHAQFTDNDPSGRRVPGAAEAIAAVGLTVDTGGRVSGSLRLRHFGPRPLIEDNSVRSDATALVNAQVSYRLSGTLRLTLDAFNLLNARASDVDYFYTSRLPGEPAGGVADRHTHPALPRTIRIGTTVEF